MAKPTYFYGIHAISELLSQRPMDALTLFVQQGDQKQAGDRLQKHTPKSLIDLAQSLGISVQFADKDKLTKLCQSPQHQGFVLHARPLHFVEEGALGSFLPKPDLLVLVLDQITDPHNFGACLRTAVAMGVDLVICPKHHTAGLTPSVAKVSVGAAELIPVMAVTNLARTLNQLKAAGVFVYGTALDQSAKPIFACDFSGKVALVMGSEGEGIRRLTAETCDELVYIPMTGNANGMPESLNVSVATGMALYEVCRQKLAQAQ